MLKQINRYSFYIMLLNIIGIQARMIDLDSLEQLHTEISANKTPVMLVFEAEWCSACQTIKKPLASVMQESEFANITTIHIDINKFPETVNEFGIVGIPTLKFFAPYGVDAGTTMGAIDPTTYKDDLRNELRTKFSGAPQEKHKETLPKSSEKNDAAGIAQIPEDKLQENDDELFAEEEMEQDNKSEATQQSTETSFFSRFWNGVFVFFKKIVDFVINLFR